MTLQQEADRLYALPLEEFTASRNERAKEVRASGDRELAGRLRKLAKPRRVAWVLNMLVRRAPDDVDRLVELGGQIRAAQSAANRDELRELDRQRRELTGALTRQARSTASELGHDVDDHLAAELESTLRAAMADPSGGAALRTGLLIDSFGFTGFEPVDVDKVVAVPDAVDVPEPSPDEAISPPRLHVVREPARETKPRRKTDSAQQAKPERRAKTKAPPADRAREQAQQAVQSARDALTEASKGLVQATQSHTDAADHREELEAERATLQERLRAIDRELARAHRTEDKAHREQDRAERESAKAQRALERAEGRLESL